MTTNDRQVIRGSLALIHRALAELSTAPLSEPATVRLARLHALYNVTDHVLGMTTHPYVSDAFKAEHMRYSVEWRENLNIRTCSYCGTYMHDSHTVVCESPTGELFAFCENCAIANGFAEACPQCGLVYTHEDMVTYIPAYLNGAAVWYMDDASMCTRVCVNCFPSLSPASAPLE